MVVGDSHRETRSSAFGASSESGALEANAPERGSANVDADDHGNMCCCCIAGAVPHLDLIRCGSGSRRDQKRWPITS